tara:strand:+ start:357 stop:698 length:342 start_codon:yes stop_codon:yes gene_type:complete
MSNLADAPATSGQIAQAADAFASKIQGMHWSDRPNHGIIKRDASIHWVRVKSDEDESDRIELLSAGTDIDLGREYCLPYHVINGMLGIRQTLMIDHILTTNTPRAGGQSGMED